MVQHSLAVIQRDSVAVIQRDSLAVIQRDSLAVIQRDSLAVIQRDYTSLHYVSDMYSASKRTRYNDVQCKLPIFSARDSASWAIITKLRVVLTCCPGDKIMSIASSSKSLSLASLRVSADELLHHPRLSLAQEGRVSALYGQRLHTPSSSGEFASGWK